MYKNIFCGIDPGASGAIVLLQDGSPTKWMLMPTYKIGSATRVNAAEIYCFLNQHEPVTHIYVEQVGAMPGQGVSSMFNFGHSCGTIMGVIGALNCPYTLIHPNVWKRQIGIIGEGKDGARIKAMQMWPEWKELNKKIKGQALADAALIALAGRKKVE
jgi:crossover junction endodeoxyribonuclease RuvC